MPTLSPSEDNALSLISQKLGANKQDLFDLINMESKWNPQIKNPRSSARGLIQFMDSTAKGMGYKGGSSEIISKYPDRRSQLLTPVYNYLKPMSPFPNRQNLFMAVFYPAYRNKHPSTPFPTHVQNANPNINTVQDYMDYANRNAGRLVVKGGLGLGTIALIALAYYYRKKLKKVLKIR